MRRYIPLAASVAGAAALVLLVPVFNAAQPRGARLTRGDAGRIAERQARSMGIPVEKAWPVIFWIDSSPLDKVLREDTGLRRRAHDDPVIGPRLGGYRVTFHRRNVDKSVPYGQVYVSPVDGSILAARVRQRPEEAGANATDMQLRPLADAFVRGHRFPGAPTTVFESARPMVYRSRTDWIFRYRVPSSFPTGKVVPYLYVHFIGDKLSGWELIEEYADGSLDRGDSAGEIGGFFALLTMTYVLVLLLLIIFLRKYHAGEAGVTTASLLFFVVMGLFLVLDIVMHRSMAEGLGMGSIDAATTALAQMGFKLLFFDVPATVLVFFAWAVGESYARERWGERLASFDALLRRDAINATVGRSMVRGVLFAPAVAAATLLLAAIPVTLRWAWPTLGRGTDCILALGGPITAPLSAILDSAVLSVVMILFILAFTSRQRALPVGIGAAVVLGVLWGGAEPPIGPVLQKLLFGFGGIAVLIAVFLAFDLLASATAAFTGVLLTLTLPLISVSQGHLLRDLLLVTAIPLAGLLIFGIAGLLSRREIVYQYEDLAPHVRRIIERERVKAEIDAANRIQAALLPEHSPAVEGASFASHYRAATEIGGDYFDFLPRPNGEIGIAFGDVSGHGLTSGIVMAMAKSALLVQLEHNPSPRAILEMLNDIVIKTAPKRILMTFFFGVLDPREQTLCFASAGHLDPYVFRAATRRLEPLSAWGFPLGVRRRDPFHEQKVRFDAGDRLVLYSDGLIEALDDDGEPFGFDRFEHMLTENGHLSADEIKRKLLDAVRRFTRNRPPEDDQTLVVVAFEEVAQRVAVA